MNKNQETLADVCKALLQLASFIKNNPNVQAPRSAQELMDMNDKVMEIIKS